ncbi:MULTISPECIES: TauD/TfdA family dioxygenase [unclassified Streptomyces]|uniref:TauD/TfdA dioxygenase family protein n=1 Tax=unclassified Streptomyces TaxID=2593676 RepID=UPI00087FE5ED|nr:MULTISPECIES: TauD/TfdA family dioxygenase [unclassified Streptomyces]PBC82293.1 taurine dioxygenase [Streptomyces sp. 2321.6]SDR50418.1 taurine dioxygenase [Streptomyces sp. KS_16]SEC51807.1 taurine dioxygenase [Streptomyces sp. 2133.1]SNC68021.1 taurine dioxygenase [Streptomyces sp. 2114.4]
MTTLADSAASPAPVPTPVLRPHRIPADGLYEGHRVLRRTPDHWEDRPYERFEVVPQAATIGAEIRGVDLSRPLSDGLRAELNRALLEWKVLFFRGQHLSSAAQREFARNWGELETNPLLAWGDSKDVVRFDKAAGGAPTFENVWHTDVTFRERPALGAVLQLREVPPAGGDTLWADMAAAYDNLPPEIRARVNGARAVHDYLPGFSRFYSTVQLAPFQEQFPPVEHPVVRRHPETGRRMLFVNASFTTRIVGLEEVESDRLLRVLFQQAQVPEFQVRWRWQAGDLAFWDNRATQHYAVNDYGTHRRVAERVAIAGDRPY